MARIGTLFSIALFATAAHAEAPRRVLIVDAISFSPALERSNTHQKMVDAVSATLTLHGWQAAPSTDCHDFTCVGPAAAGAGANYAVILTGSFGHGEDMSATDVGVSLWRDGSVVARRTEADEKAEAEKTPAAEFFACGPPSGTCIAPLITSKMQQYSARLLDAESAAVQQREVAATPKAVAPSPPVLVTPAPAPASQGDGGVGRIVGWSLIGLGVAALAAGVSLWALDGHASGTCDTAGSMTVCKRYDTATSGEILTAIGAAAGVAGGIVLWRAESERSPSVAFGFGSLFVRGRF
jgi:hypothetical protein